MNKVRERKRERDELDEEVRYPPTPPLFQQTITKFVLAAWLLLS